MPSSHLILCRPLLLLPPVPPSISLFQWVNSSQEVAKVLEFSFSIIPSKEIPGLIFRTDWLDLLAVQGTLKSLLQHHSSKASILRRSAFFHWFTCTMNGPFTTCDSVTLWIGHLEKTGLLSCEDHCNIDTFHYIIFLKITFTNITTNFIRKAFNYDKLLSSWWWMEVLQKFNFCLKAPILSLETNTISCVLWRDRHISFVSPESTYQIPSIWITIV